MSKATTLRQAAAAVMSYSKTVAEGLRKDRDWLWLVGNLKDEPEARSVLKETGWRFSKPGHEIEETGERAHWYFAEKYTGGLRRGKVKARRAASKASSKSNQPNPELLCTNPNEEFEAMFG